MDKSEKNIELKYNKLVAQADKLSYAIALMERSLDFPSPDATEDWRVSCEIARAKKIIELESVSSALAKVCSEDIKNKDRLISKEIEKSEKGIQHATMIAESRKIKLELERQKKGNIDAHLAASEERKLQRSENLIEAERLRLEAVKVKAEKQREVEQLRLKAAKAKAEKQRDADLQTESFHHEMKRLIKDRLGVDAYLDLVSEVKSNIGIGA